jgi:hypothetical protein
VEGVAFAGKQVLYFSSEGRPPVFKQTLYRTSVDALLNAKPEKKKNRKSPEKNEHETNRIGH